MVLSINSSLIFWEKKKHARNLSEETCTTPTPRFPVETPKKASQPPTDGLINDCISPLCDYQPILMTSYVY